jgi:DNA-directed RNA polymerase subunit RPC12/RpoP
MKSYKCSSCGRPRHFRVKDGSPRNDKSHDLCYRCWKSVLQTRGWLIPKERTTPEVPNTVPDPSVFE